MNELPVVTIVTPSYNQGAFLEKTILSVLTQDYPNIEYIVIDGGSNDNSVEIIKKYSDRIEYWVSEKDNGQSDAINKGWRRAKGKYCSYLNSDDTLAPGSVTKIVKAFTENPDAGVIYGDYTFIDTNNQVLEVSRGAQSCYKKLLIDGQMPDIAQPSSFYLTSLVKQVGYIDERLHLSMDYDLLLKLAKSSRMVYIAEPISYFRLHPSSKTSSFAKRHWHETLRVKFKHSIFFSIKSVLIYLRFRIFHLMPSQIIRMVRKKRNSVHDRILLGE